MISTIRLALNDDSEACCIIFKIGHYLYPNRVKREFYLKTAKM